MAQVVKQNETVSAPKMNNGNGNGKNTPAERKEGEIVKSPWNVKSLSLQEADKAIAKIVTSGKELRRLAHETACGILLHYAEHGDYTRLQRENDTQSARLYEAISEAMSRSMGRAFIDWVIKYSSIRYNKDTRRFYHNKRDKRISEGKRGFFDAEAAIAEPFFAMERDPVAPKALSAEEILAILANTVQRLERLAKQKEEGVKVGGKTVKVRHQLPSSLIDDFRKFATDHGVKFEGEAA